MNLDVVITGLDVEDHIEDCVAAVRASSYHKGELRPCYADQGSSDSSVLLARRIEGLTVLHGGGRPLGLAEARNLGWKAGKAPAVVFLDARSRIEPDWIELAVRALDRDVGAVSGPRIPPPDGGFWTRALLWEDRPRVDVDDPLPAGECLVRRKALRDCGGFEQALEPESMAGVGAYLLDRGWLVRLTLEPMARSGAVRMGAAAYLAHCFRQGLAFADLWLRFGLLRRTYPGRPGQKALRAVIRCVPALILCGLGLAGLVGSGWDWLPLAPLGAFLALYPRIWRIGEFAASRELSIPQSCDFAWARCASAPLWAAGFLARLMARPWRVFRRPRRVSREVRDKKAP